MGWNDITVPSKAPTRETISSKAGIVLAIMYAINVMAKLQPSHVHQWFIVLPVECLDPGRMRTKMYFANNCRVSISIQDIQAEKSIDAYMGHKNSGSSQLQQRKLVEYLLHGRSCRPEGPRSNIRAAVVVYHAVDRHIDRSYPA